MCTLHLLRFVVFCCGFASIYIPISFMVISMVHSWEKSLLTPIWGNKIDMNLICVLPVGWNWHEMYLWLLPNEIRPYLGRTCTSTPSGMVEVQNRSLGGHSPKSVFAPWHVRINNCICFSQFSLIVLIMPHPTPIGIRHGVLALVREGMRHSAITYWSRVSDSCYR